MEYSEQELLDMAAIARQYKRHDVNDRLKCAAACAARGDELGVQMWIEAAECCDVRLGWRRVMGLCKSAIACPSAA